MTPSSRARTDAPTAMGEPSSELKTIGVEEHACAAEFERSVKELGMVGAMLFPRTGERYLDHEVLSPIFDVADSLEAPVYVHPQFPPQAVHEAYFNGFSPRST